MNWIKHPLTLEGEKVILVPLSEMYFDELIDSCRHKIIWTYMPVKANDADGLRKELTEALLEREKGTQCPFVVIEKTTNKVIGSTRFLKLTEEHRNLEIGWTWYLPEYWRKGYNEECKLLLLTYCFEILKTIRVQIIASDKNLRSRKAIERIGGKFEGILRNVVLRHDGPRTTAYYSIIDSEWEEVKANLLLLLQAKIKDGKDFS